VKSKNGPVMSQNRFVQDRLRIARSLSKELRRELGANVIGIGITGSVARGRAQKYSDIDMEIVLSRPGKQSYQARIIDNVYCSLTFATRTEALSEISRPHRDLSERLGGFTKIRPIYDPKGFLKRLESRAKRTRKDLFLKSAELALLESYEDFCRAKNAYLNSDDIVLRDNAINVTYFAALATASLNMTYFESDREIFKAYRRLRKLPRGFGRIEALRYGNMRRKDLFRTLMSFYIDLVEFCVKEGVRFPVTTESLQET